MMSMHWLNRLGLRFRLLIPFVVLTLLTTTAVTCFCIWGQSVGLDKLAQRAGQRTGELVSGQEAAISSMQSNLTESFAGQEQSLNQGFTEVKSKLATELKATQEAQADRMEAGLESKVTGLSELLAPLASIALQSFDFDALNEYCERACGDPDVALCYVTTGDSPVTVFRKRDREGHAGPSRERGFPQKSVSWRRP